ncbi:hypothetical protein Dred_2907 [Desulforamulus reducens MI-1]|uniref:Spore coat associated protein CotJA n=1 Tax=Desulforamulus reducens (strain ATCC BAA-1160 / DSM 100696 / MI-1) TaxID=349161 RepID=A4J8K8_DESRM|nr:spore coat associated protein CotJA [Desulforamulus reducens]ABO51411.1 hypothetical protein Dred_2907 [Desulforamulus reducens MI-1]
MSKEDKKIDQTKAQAAPMGPMTGQQGMVYPGQPGINPPYPPMPGTQPGYCPGVPYPGMELAQAYVPIQPCGGPQYDLRKALEVGTLYPELYKPYLYPHK